MAYSVTIGRVEIISLTDVPNWHLSGFMADVDPDLWERYREKYPEAQEELNSLCIAATGYVVRTPTQTVLVDAGLGPGPHRQAGNQTGKLLDEMKTVGLTPDDIDIVIVTHLHNDHIGWTAVSDSETTVQQTFKKARYYMPKNDWEFFHQPQFLAPEYSGAPFLRRAFALHDRKVVELTEGASEISAEVTILAAPGHTPGHQVISVQSEGGSAMIIGDMAHTPAQVQQTDWCARGDRDKPLAMETRARVFDQVETEHILLCAGHFPYPYMGYLAREGDQRVYQSL